MAAILVVDDHVAIGTGLRKILADAGHSCTVVNRAAEVLSSLRGGTYEVAIIDLVFDKEHLSGIDVLDMVHRHDPNIRFVLYTSDDGSRTHHIYAALAQFPIRGGLPKDASDEAIVRCVNAVVAGKEHFEPEIDVFRTSKTSDPSIELMRVPAHAAIWGALARGHTSIETIAETINYSTSTVRNATGPMCDKLRDLGLVSSERTSIAELAAYAADHRSFFLNWWYRRQSGRPDDS